MRLLIHTFFIVVLPVFTLKAQVGHPNNRPNEALQAALSQCAACPSDLIQAKTEAMLSVLPRLLLDSSYFFTEDISTNVVNSWAKSGFSYDNLERLTQERRNRFDKNLPEPHTFQQTDYTYPTAGRDFQRTLQTSEGNGPLTFQTRTVFTVNGQTETSIYQVYDPLNQTWADRSFSIKQKIAPNQELNTEGAVENGVQKLMSRYLVVYYKGNLRQSIIYESLNEQTGVLDSSSRYSYEYDNADRRTLDRNEQWYAGIGWRANSEIRTAYNADGLRTVEQHLERNSATNALEQNSLIRYQYKGMQLDSVLRYALDQNKQQFLQSYRLYEYKNDALAKDSIYITYDATVPLSLSDRYFYTPNPAPFNEVSPHAVTRRDIWSNGKWEFESSYKYAWSDLGNDRFLNEILLETPSFNNPDSIVTLYAIDLFYRAAKLSAIGGVGLDEPISIVPNPVRRGGTLRFDGLPVGENLDMMLYNGLGQAVLQQKSDAQTGLTVDHRLPPGAYYLLVSKNGKALKHGKVMIVD